MTPNKMRQTQNQFEEWANNKWEELEAEYPKLRNWKWAWNHNAKSRFGVCKFRSSRIEMSVKPFYHGFDDTNWLMDEMKDTFLHEIAHALAGFDAAHGHIWKLWCVKVGARPERCGSAQIPRSEQPKDKFKWNGYCDCKEQPRFRRHKLSRKSLLYGQCTRCRMKIRWVRNW